MKRFVFYKTRPSSFHFSNAIRNFRFSFIPPLAYQATTLTHMQKTAHAHDGQFSTARPCIANRFTSARRKSRFAHVPKSAFLDFDILRVATKNARSVAFSAPYSASSSRNTAYTRAPAAGCFASHYIFVLLSMPRNTAAIALWHCVSYDKPSRISLSIFSVPRDDGSIL